MEARSARSAERIATIHMRRPRHALAFIALTLLASGCEHPDTTPYTGGDGSVPLAMRVVADSVWELRYHDPTGESRIRVRTQVPPMSDSTPFAFGTWTLYRVPGYSPRALLAALAVAHSIPDTVTPGSPADSMRLDVAVLAVNAARSRDGAFGRAGTGTWIVAKLFFADDEGEVYLNLNPSRGEAEFSVKDKDYGPVVLREIGRLRAGSERGRD